ncbi:unnamed protein product [Polarella glacialis]|uniref:Uncharacterized protein n=1 Tax=Polarella glacialis TaxID=89957 RepID=A0A813G9X0_POLGL|nr:unnamed protein product [Polarella glacialis]CAE8619487.1 unnamed protein product [Polarella glacialis]CAE8719918.1 unnamed protein product [Polarella glacialis]
MRDFFGKPRFHCTSDGCTCGDFQPLKQKILEEEGEEAVSRFKSCQGRSMVELTCGTCGHNVSDHALKPKLGRLLADPGPASYKVTAHGVCFRKPGFDPAQPKILRLTGLTPGTEVLATGLLWRGQQGGLWAELRRAQACALRIKGGGWLLVEAAGDDFGVQGPLLEAAAGPVEWKKGEFHVLDEDATPPPGICSASGKKE